MKKYLLLLILALLIVGCDKDIVSFGTGSGSGSTADLVMGSGGFNSGSGDSGGGDSGGGDAGGEAPVINPEPTTIALFGIGLSGLAAAKWRKRKR